MTTLSETRLPALLEGFPLSPQQRDAWLRHGGTGESMTTLTCAVDIAGHLDRDALQRAVAELVRRHEILRTGFRTMPGLTLPVQVISATADVLMEEIGPAASGPADADGLMARWARRPVDPARESQLSTALWQRSADRHTLLLRLPVLCADSATMECLVQQVVTLYRGGPPTVPGTERPQYADLSEWMNELSVPGNTAAGAEDRPRQTAEGAPRMPFQLRAEPEGSTDLPAVGTLQVPVTIAPAVWSLAQLTAQRLSVPLRTLLAGCWATTLYRYARQQSMTLTVATDGRDREELRGAMGPFTQDLPMHLEISDTAPVQDVVRQFARLDSGLREPQSFLDPQRWAPQEDTGRRSAPPVAFAHHTVAPLPTGGPTTFSMSSLECGAGHHPLELRCVELPDSVQLTLFHCPKTYRRDDVAQLGTSLSELIRHASEAPETAVGRLRLTGSTVPRWPVGADAKAGEAAHDEAPSPVHELFERHVAATPHATAVVYEDDCLTYEELSGCARRIAARLVGVGVRPGDLVPLYADRGLDSIAAVLGILMAGAAYVPLDSGTPVKRLAFVLDDIDPRLVLTQAHLAGRLPAGRPLIHLDELRDPVAGTAPGPAATQSHPRHPAYVIYTSGTTGMPKGVVVEHSQLAHYVAGLTATLGTPGAGGFAMVSSLASDLGNTALFHALCGGGTLHVISKDRASDPDALAAYLRTTPVDRMKIVPSHLRALLDAAARPGDLLPRTALVLGGESCQLDLADRIKSLAPSCKVINHYGPTETTVGASTHDVAVDGVDGRCRTVPIGRPIGKTRLLVLDPCLNPVPDWVPGEAYVAGPQVSRGYLNHPELTAERFLPDPSGDTPGSRMYRTGDRVRRLPGGIHEFLGRTDDQIKVRGFRVEPAEVETVIRTHPGVRDVAVLAREDAVGDRHLVAYLVLRHAEGTDGHAVGADIRIREFLYERLPDHMVPASTEVVEAFPLTPNGKVDREALLRRVPSARPPQRTVVPPRDDDEARLLSAWEDTLGTRPLGVTDNFFDVGGNSLLAVRLIARIRRTTGRSLPLASLFPAGTVESMARLMREDHDDSSGRSSIVVPIQPLGTRRPFFCVHAGGGTTLGYRDLARHLGPAQPFHGIQSLGLDGAQAPLPTLSGMARRYVECIREVQPKGPYLIGGWCLGGIIAYEMTRVLRDQGQPTSLLVLIDSESPSTAAASLKADFGGTTAGPELDGTSLLRRFAWHFGIDVTRSDLGSLTDEQQLKLLFDLARSNDVLPPDAEPEHLGHLLGVYKNNIQAVNTYLRKFTPEGPPDHPVVLYRPVEELDAGQDASFGWSALAGSRLTIQLVPGDHHSVMRPPAVATLGERLRTLLDTFGDEGDS